MNENTHLDAAIEVYRKVTSFDFETYEDLVIGFLMNNGIKTVEKLDFLKRVINLPSVVNTTIYFKQEESGELRLEPDKIENGYPLVGISEEEIKRQIDRLKPRGSRGTLTKILKGMEYLKKINESKMLKSPDSTKEELLSHLSIFNEEQKQVLTLLSLDSGDEHLKETLVDRLNIKIFSHLSKSILNAEYLILKDYKIRLSKMERYFDAKPDEDNNEVDQKNGRLYTEKAFLRVSWHLQEACSFISRYLHDNKAFNLLLVNSDRKKRFRRKDIYKTEYWGGDRTAIYESLLESIIHMTIIDHYFRSDAEAVEKLFHLYDQMKKIRDKHLSDDELYEEVIEEVLAKVSTMLDLILNNKFHEHTEPDIDVDYYYIINSKNDKDNFIEELAQYCKRNTSGNKCLNLKRENKGKVFKNSVKKFIFDEVEFSDLKLYYDAIIAGTNSYCEQSVVISKIHLCNGYLDYLQEDKPPLAAVISTAPIFNSETGATPDNAIALEPIQYCEDADVITVISTFLEKKQENLTPSFFRQVLAFINYCIEKEEKSPTPVENTELPKSIVYQTLLKKALNQLFRFLNKFESDIPFCYRPYFENSFYAFENNVIVYSEIKKDQDPLCDAIKDYHKDKFVGKFFFASIDCMPINYMYMSKLYNKYKALQKEYASLLDVENKLKIRREFLQLTSNVDQNLKQTALDLKSDLNSSLEITSRDLTNKNLDHMVTTLGIFAAFIAFVTITINQIKVAQNIWQFIVFAITFTCCLLLFVIYLKHGDDVVSYIKRNKENSEETKVVKKDIWGIAKHIMLTIVGCVVLLGVFSLTSYVPVFNVDIQVQQKDSIINQQAIRENQLVMKYDSLLKDYRLLKSRSIDNTQLDSIINQKIDLVLNMKDGK